MSDEVAEFHPFKFYKENPSLIRTRSGLICDGCGCNFVRPRHYINHRVDSQKRMFCSSECWMKTVSKTVETNCHNCNATIKIKPAVAKRSRRHFCSRKCSGEYFTKISISSELLKILDFDIRL